jgi:ligand-binding sensor domain-containing protein
VKKWWSKGLLVTAVVAAGGAGLVYWQAGRAVRESAESIEQESRVRFTAAPLDRTPPPGVEWIGAPAVFTDAAQFAGNLYLCGPAGLFVYDAEGALRARYRVGLELPAAPLVSLAAGVPADSGQPELLIATSGEGLLAFDGRRFRQIRPDDPAHRKLTAVLPLTSGHVLLGTEEKGVLRYDGKTLAPFHPRLAGIPVTALAGDESSLWVGTRDRGVLHWHAGQVASFSEDAGLPDPQVLSLTVSGDAAYAGTPLGVAEFRGGRLHRKLASGFFARILQVHNGSLVVGTMEEGTIDVPLGERRPRSLRPQGQPLAGEVRRLLEIDGSLYALAPDGLYALKQSHAGWRRVLAPDPALLADANIAALSFDPAGKLWVGYFDRGLDIVTLDAADPARSSATHVEDDHVFCVNRIVHDTERNLSAVATANGLVLFDASGRQQQVLDRAQGLIADHVTDVALYPGGMAVATPAGLTFLDQGGMRSLYAFHGLVNNHAYSLAASGGRLLVGTLGGLSIVEDGLVRASFTTANSGLRHNWVTSLLPVGDDWFVGTYGAGILRLDGAGHWHAFPDATAAFEVNPNAMLSSGGRVYAGTLGRGLYVFSRESGRWTTWQAGLPSLNVTALAARDGYLYIGTDNGLVRIPEEAIP